MGNYKCCECGSDLGLKSTAEIVCPKCEGFSLHDMANPPPIPAAMGDVWTTDPPKELGWYKVLLSGDKKSMVCVTSVGPRSGDTVWATVGPLNELHIGVSSRVYSNPMVSFWGEKVL